MTGHFKSTLTLPRGPEAKKEHRLQKILKAPLSAHLGINETSSDALNETDTDLNSENSPAPRETGAQSQGCESSVARPRGSEAAAPAPAADAASREGSPATGARDEGQAKAVIAQPGEPSVEVAKKPGKSAETTKLVARSRSSRSTRQRLILSGRRRRPSMTGIMRLLSVFLQRLDGRTLPKPSRSH